MTSEELDTTANAHLMYIKHAGIYHDPYNAPFGIDDLLHVARTYDRTGRRYHLSANTCLRLMRYVMSLVVEIRQLRARVTELENGNRAAGVDMGGAE